MRTLVAGSILLLAATALPAQTPAARDEASQNGSAMPVDLTRLVWRARTGFDAADPVACPFLTPVGERAELQLHSFPIVLNSVFKTPTGSGLRQYTLCTRFELTSADLRRSPGLHLPWMGEAWEVYLNGQLQADELFLTADGDRLAARRILRHQTVPLDAAALRVGMNVLTLRLAGYQAPTGLENNTNFGLLFANGYVVDAYAKLSKEHDGHFRTMLTTVFFFFGGYHLLFFLYRRKDVYNLFFGIFAVAMALDSFTGSGAAQDLFLDTAWINRVKYAAQTLAGGAMLLFLMTYFFRSNGFGFGGWTVLIWSLVLALAFAAAPFEYTEALLPVLHGSLVLAFVYGGTFIVRAVYRRKEDSLILSAGTAALLLTGMWDVLGTYIYPLSFLLAPIGTLACVLSLVFMLARRFLRVNNESERLNQDLTVQKNSFRRFVPVQFLDLLDKRDIVDVTLGDSTRRTVSVLFADIRSFTGLSETMDAGDNFRFLNSFLRRMEPNIQENGGFVDKFIGDAIMALFPLDGNDQSADSAVRTAVSLQREVIDFNEQRRSNGYDPIRVGIGVNTGEVMLGTVGSLERLDTTAIGDTVNLASRLEGLTRFYDCGVLISDYTARRLVDMDAYHWREIDAVVPYGKKSPVMVYEIYDADPPGQRAAKDRTREELVKGIVRYKSGNFQDALLVFQHIQSELPEDRLLQIYIDRCREYLANPPEEDWIGVAALGHK